MFFNTLIGRIMILTLLLFTVAIGAVTLFHIKREHEHITSTSNQTAELLMSVIERAISSSMSTGNTEDVQKILETVGTDPRLVGVRIFHPNGRVLKSSDPQEIGRRVNPHDLAIFLTNQNSEVFRGMAGEEILGVVKPIYSEQQCTPCHGRGRRVIGVLNLDFALGPMEEQLIASSRFFGVSMIVMIVMLTAGVVMIFLRFVRRPLQQIASKMAMVEAGDLSAKLNPSNYDEVGSLMRSFNSMVERLRAANDELQQYHNQQMQRADRHCP